ncbi:Pyrroline-5-carboxylate reductase [Clostridiaceae bacterium JG1575]|nr:Pyrroline-5-carboxylate reductase [Clostridiaceae bacterium JG1575]
MNIGFLGFGAMAQAMSCGLQRKREEGGLILGASARDAAKLQKYAQPLGVRPFETNRELAKWAQVLFLCVKPHQVAAILQEIRGHQRRDQLLISVAAGISLDDLMAHCEEGAQVLRALPNTPVRVGAGMTLYSPGPGLKAQMAEMGRELLASFGLVERIEEEKMAAAGSLTGCTPAFFCMVLDALADGAVHQGVSREAALRLAAASMKGTAELCLITKDHPAVLKDQVTSPKGTTIEGLRTLERQGLRSALMEALIASCVKTRS